MLDLDPELFPETVAYLESIKHVKYLSSFNIASHILECDKTSSMTPELFNFVVECFEEAIKEGNNYVCNNRTR